MCAAMYEDLEDFAMQDDQYDDLEDIFRHIDVHGDDAPPANAVPDAKADDEVISEFEAYVPDHSEFI